MRTLPQQTLTIRPDHPIHLPALTSLHGLLTHAIDLLKLTLSYSYPSATATTPLPHDLPPPQFLSAQLRLLAQSLSEASALLKGPPLTVPDPSWTTRSVSPSHFAEPHTSTSGGGANNNQPPPLSFHLGIQDSSLVLWLRSLEPADAPLNFGTKLALAIGTARRLEHDESERVFGYCCSGDDHHHYGPAREGREDLAGSSAGGGRGGGGAGPGARPGSSLGSPPGGAVPLSGTRQKSVDVYVREKVRVESADPSLLSLSAKLSALGHTLALARRNLAAVMGEEIEMED